MQFQLPSLVCGKWKAELARQFSLSLVLTNELIHKFCVCVFTHRRQCSQTWRTRRAGLCYDSGCVIVSVVILNSESRATFQCVTRVCLVGSVNPYTLLRNLNISRHAQWQVNTVVCTICGFIVFFPLLEP